MNEGDATVDDFFNGPATDESGDEAQGKPELCVSCKEVNRKMTWTVDGQSNQPFSVAKKAVAKHLGTPFKLFKSKDAVSNKGILIDAMTGDGSSKEQSTRTVDVIIATMQKLELRNARPKKPTNTPKETLNPMPPLPEFTGETSGLLSPGVFTPKRKHDHESDDEDVVITATAKRVATEDPKDPFEVLKTAVDRLATIGVKVADVAVSQVDPTQPKELPDCPPGPTRDLFSAVSDLGKLGLEISYKISVAF